MTDPKPASDFPAEHGSGVRLRASNVTRLPRLKPVTYGECQAEGLGSRVPCGFTDCIENLGGIGGETCTLAVVESNPDGCDYRTIGDVLGLSHARIEQILNDILERPRMRFLLRPWAEGRAHVPGPVLGTAASVLRHVSACGGMTRAEWIERIAGDMRRKREDVSQAISKLLADGRVTEDEEGALWAN